MYDIARMLAPLRARVQAIVGRAILAAVEDSGAIQVVKIDGLAGETIDRVDHPQPFGLSAHCPPGGQAVVAFVGGSRDQGVALLIDSARYRKNGLMEGETSLYSAFGTHVYLMEDGTVEIETAGTRVRVNGEIIATGDVSDATGTLDEVRQDLAALRSEYDAHVHLCAAPGSVSGGPTAPPATI